MGNILRMLRGIGVRSALLALFVVSSSITAAACIVHPHDVPQKGGAMQSLSDFGGMRASIQLSH